MGLGVSWRQDGRELYYLAPKHAVMAVDVTASPALEVGTPRVLFNVPDATNDAQKSSASRGATWRAMGSASCTRWRRRARPLPATRSLSSPCSTARAKCCGESGRSAATGSPRSRQTARASRPDGSITSMPGGRSDIWVVDIASGKTTPITNDAPPDFAPMWSPDGKQISTCLRARAATRGFTARTADGTGDAEFIYRYEPGAPVNLRDISADGKHLLFNSGGVILVLPLGGDATTRKAIELSREEFLVNGGVLSPDGRLIAFTSNETEAFELYVRPFDAATGAAAGDAKRRCRRRAPER